MPYKSEDLTGQLRIARHAAGISQRALSARSGLTQAHISQIERGTLEPRLSSLIDMARALDLELVLVPRKLVPAVNGILHAAPERDLSPENGQAVLREIARGERLAAKLKTQYDGSADLDRIEESLHALRSAPLRPSDLTNIGDAIEMLGRRQAGEQPRNVVNEIAANLQSLRNRIAHDRAEAPRPAYDLGEDGDE